MLEIAPGRDFDNTGSAQELVDQFVERQKQIQIKLESENRRLNRSMSDLIQSSKSLPPEIVDNIFNPYLSRKISDESIADVKKSLHSMRLKINTLDAKKRFLILETMDFFRTKISLGKLIPVILLLQGADKMKAIIQFVAPAFTEINKNVETLVSTSELFDERTLHLNRGSLYAFVSDLANILLRIFKPGYLKRFSNDTSPVNLLLSALEEFYPFPEHGGDAKYCQLIDDDTQVHRILLDFIVSIQSHDALFNYAVKSNGYHKQILKGLTTSGQFQDQDPFAISKLLAGCFISNPQLKPSTMLIDAMIDRNKYAEPATIKAQQHFIEKLSPSTLMLMISQFKTHFKLLLKGKPGKQLSDIDSFSVKSILNKIWHGFTRMAENGFTRLTVSLEIVLNQLKKTYCSFVEDETRLAEQAKLELGKPLIKFIQKRSEYQSSLKKNYNIVETDIVGFSGIDQGADSWQYENTLRLFNNDEVTLLEFKYCLQRLLEYLSIKRRRQIVTRIFQQAKRLQESHTSFLFEPFLISLGLTHLRSTQPDKITENDLFPYVILFSESPDQTADSGRIASRKIVLKGKKRIFHEALLHQDNLAVLYHSLLCILHLLPAADWNASASQASIHFFIDQLNAFRDKA